MRPVDVKSSTCFGFGVENNNTNLKLVTMWEYRNIIIFLQSFTFHIGRKLLWLKNLKILYCGHKEDLKGEKNCLHVVWKGIAKN